MKKISTFLQISIICILSFGCSKTDSISVPLAETTSEARKAFQALRGVYSKNLFL
jgi:hypothetical protein